MQNFTALTDRSTAAKMSSIKVFEGTNCGSCRSSMPECRRKPEGYGDNSLKFCTSKHRALEFCVHFADQLSIDKL